MGRHTCVKTMAARPRLQSLGEDDPLPSLPSPALPPFPFALSPLPPLRFVFVSTVGGAAAAFECRPAALQLSASCDYGVNISVTSSTRRNHLPAFCAAFLHPSFELHANLRHIFHEAYHPILLLPVNNILSLRTIVSMPSEFVLASALAWYKRVRSLGFRFRQSRHRKSMEWWACRDLS